MLKLTVFLVCVALIGQTLCQQGIPKAQVDARVGFFFHLIYKPNFFF